MESTNEMLVTIDRDIANIAMEILNTMNKLEAMLYELGAIRKTICHYSVRDPKQGLYNVRGPKMKIYGE